MLPLWWKGKLEKRISKYVEVIMSAKARVYNVPAISPGVRLDFPDFLINGLHSRLNMHISIPILLSARMRSLPKAISRARAVTGALRYTNTPRTL